MADLVLQMPLGDNLDFRVDSEGNMVLFAWDKRLPMKITPDEFGALFHLLHDNHELLMKNIPVLKEVK